MPSSDTYFRRGQSGNPGGRPKGPSVATCLMRILDLPDVADFVPRTKAERIALSLYEQACAGERNAVAAIRTVLERTDGAVPQWIGHAEVDPLELSRRFALDLTGRGELDELLPPATNGNGKHG